MKKIWLLLFSLLFITRSYAQNPNLGIIPAPKSVKSTGGKFQFSNNSGILFETEEEHKIAILFSEFLKDTYALSVPVARNFIKAPQGVIRFSGASYNGTNAEGYNLTVDPAQITVSGRGAGLFYGLQSLMQLFPVDRAGVPAVPCTEIQDEPRYQYRGMHLDVCRHIFPLPFIKKYIDMLAQYKLNTFHWHLTDDQGWRIEIKKYPKLTQVGGYRAQTLIGNYHDRMPQWFDNTPYGGYYTQEQIKDVVNYASSKFITVIPEIELPGHAMAALSAYPELACGDNPGPFKAAEKWGVFDDVFCGGKENTFNFLEDVLTEVIELFPSQFIHIGGDECPKVRWKECKYCQKRMRDNQIRTAEQLQSYFIHRIEAFVNSKGRQIIGWDEILQGGLAPNATVMSWTGVNGGITAAKQNHNAIMTPGGFVYFDHAQGRTDQEPLTIGGSNPLQKVYSYNPTPVDLTPQQQERIIGVQANMWTEYISTPAKVEYMLLPRMLALSEVAWTSTDRKNFTDFAEQRLPVHLARLDKTATNYRVPAAIGIKDTVMYGPKFTFSLKPSVEGATIYYTNDGYQPRETDLPYTLPIDVTVPQGERRIIKTLVITPSGKRSAVTTTTLINEPATAPLADSLAKKAGLKYYYVPGDFLTTLSVDTLKAAEKGIASALTLAKFRGKARTYGLVFSGFINIRQDGVHVFSTASDDGSQIWIDGKPVVENDEKHATFERTGAVNLLKGLHKIEIRYFQAGGGNELRVYLAEPGKVKSEIPAALLLN